MNDLFEKKAEEFDTMDLPQVLSQGIGRCMVEHVDLHPGMEVMDFGAGTGLVTRRIVDKVGRVTAVDISPAMLDKLAAKEELRGKVEIECRNIVDIPMDRQFDLIVSAMAMHHVENTEQMVRSFWEHLRPGGHIALADLDAEDGDFHPADAAGVHHAGFDRAAFGQILQNQGFANVRFFDALTVEREGRAYPVFLAVADKP
jgi:2-polyprenyl-3-methyl-5-hydroxy-6-metoxy-1,4-benzoquinol methylase